MKSYDIFTEKSSASLNHAPPLSIHSAQTVQSHQPIVQKNTSNAVLLDPKNQIKEMINVQLKVI